MKKLRVSILLIVVALLMLLPLIRPGQHVKAGFYETTYTVYYNCIIGPSPQPPNDIVGEWDVDCFGNWTGWGWMPGDNCTRTVAAYGNECQW
jgi:hypothetical protein